MTTTAGSMNELIYGDSGADLIATGAGSDVIYAAEGNNVVKTGAGDDIVYGGSGDDKIYTGDGNDVIFAAEGSNVVKSGTGEDVVYLGSQSDKVILTAGAGSVTIYGFNPKMDQLTWDQSLSGKTIQFATQGNDTLVKAGDDLLATLKWSNLKGSKATGEFKPSYKAIELGALSPDANNVRGAAINDAGQISGRSEIGVMQKVGDRTFILNQGFIWQSGQLSPLPLQGLKVGGSNDGQTITMPGAGGFVQAMNNSGVVIGAADEVLGKSTDRALLYQPQADGSYSFQINDFGGIESYFFDINSQGQLAGRHIYGPGSTETASNRSRPIYWEEGVKYDLPDLGGDTGTTRGINDRGQMVGQIDSDGLNDKTVNTAALWEKGSDGTYLLTNLGTFGAEQSIARDINEAGQIIGWKTNGTATDTKDSLFLLEHGVLTDLGGFGGKRGETADINEFGQVVGYSQTADGKDRAFIWQDGEMYDLNKLVGGKLTWQGSDVTLTRATGINNQGDIVSYGTYTYLDAAGKEQTGTRTFLLSAMTDSLLG